MVSLIWILMAAQTLLASDDVCLKNKIQLEREARNAFLKIIKTEAVKTVTAHYQKNNLAPVKHIEVIPQTEALLLKVNAGKDSVLLKAKWKEKIKVTIWPEDKKEVDALGRPLMKGQKCLARAYAFSTDKEKLFVDVVNAESAAVVTGFSVTNLAEISQTAPR